MNSFGTCFRVEILGESHGPAVGVVVDGCPPGTPLSPEDFEADLARRRAGRAGTTERHERDRPEIVSGLYRGATTGTPLCVLFRNEDTRSEDYSRFTSLYRPGHADFTAARRYRGFADPRGSGHSSGRVTLGIVAAGTVAKRILTGLSFTTRLAQVGGREDIEAAIAEAAARSDSVGGLVELRVGGLPSGLGEPFFDSVEGLIAHLVFAVPGVRGVEFGDGFAAAAMRGSEHNDPFVDRSGRTARNGSGGINGGITNGNELVMRVAVKPASSIGLAQQTLDFATGRMAELQVGGRHDSCIALRAAVVIEAAAAIALADLALMARTYGEREEP